MKPSELLADPKAWGQGAYAITEHNEMCEWDSPRAVKWSIEGSVRKCFEESASPHIVRLCNVVGDNMLSRWNDAPERTHEQVIAVLKYCGL